MTQNLKSFPLRLRSCLQRRAAASLLPSNAGQLIVDRMGWARCFSVFVYHLCLLSIPFVSDKEKLTLWSMVISWFMLSKTTVSRQRRHVTRVSASLNRETGSEKLQLQGEAFLLWPLWRHQLPSLWEWSHGIPSTLFNSFHFLFHPSVLGGTLIMIYFPRTSSKTSLSRKSSVTVFLLQLMIASDDFENQLFPFLGSSGGMSATGGSLCQCVNP